MDESSEAACCSSSSFCALMVRRRSGNLTRYSASSASHLPGPERPPSSASPGSYVTTNHCDDRSAWYDLVRAWTWWSVVVRGAT